MHFVAWWNPKLLNNFLPRIPMLLLQLGNFLCKPRECRHRDSCFVKSSSYAITQQERAQITEEKKKKAQQTKPEAFADLPAAAAVPAPVGWLEPVRDALVKNRLGARTELGGAGGMSQVGSHLGSDLPLTDKE